MHIVIFLSSSYLSYFPANPESKQITFFLCTGGEEVGLVFTALFYLSSLSQELTWRPNQSPRTKKKYPRETEVSSQEKERKT